MRTAEYPGHVELTCDRAMAAGYPIPTDLAQAVPEAVLVELALQSAQARPPGIVGAGTGSARNASVLMTVMIYGYARGILPSEDLVREAESDPVLRYLALNTALRAEDFRDFRRRNRLALETCLRALIVGVMDLRGTRPQLAHEADAAPLAALEAERRLARAVRLDSMALDD